MRLFWGKVARLNGKDWGQIEVNVRGSRALTSEGIISLVALWGRRFEEFELWVPVEGVDKDGVELALPYLYGRCRDLEDLREVKGVWGVEGVTEDGMGKVFRVPDEFVTQLLETEAHALVTRTTGVREKTFVRVLWGPDRMLCGTVEKIRNGMAKVKVEMRSRDFDVTVPVTSLQRIWSGKQTYFHLGD